MKSENCCFLVSHCFHVCTLFNQFFFFSERKAGSDYTSLDINAASPMSSVLFAKSESVKSAVLSQFLQLYYCRSISCQGTYFYWWDNKIEVFSNCVLFRSDSAMFSHGIILHCWVLYCHFLCTVLCCVHYRNKFCFSALHWQWIDWIQSEYFPHLLVAFCLRRFVFMAFSAPWTVARFTSTWLHTTWAFPLKCNPFLIILGLFVIVILLCDLFWVNSKKKKKLQAFPFWGYKDITDELSSTEMIYNSYHLVVKHQNAEEEDLGNVGHTKAKTISSHPHNMQLGHWRYCNIEVKHFSYSHILRASYELETWVCV